MGMTSEIWKTEEREKNTPGAWVVVLEKAQPSLQFTSKFCGGGIGVILFSGSSSFTYLML